MVVGNVPDAVDLVVVGGGPGGYVAALHAARAGRRVTLVEAGGEEAVGGTCLHVGCIPSKALIELATLRRRSLDASRMGLDVAGAAIDLGRFQTFKSGVVEQLTRGVRGLLRHAGVDIVAGRLAFTEPRTAVISLADDQVRFVQFEDAIIATGSEPIELESLRFDGERVLDSTGALALDRVPESLAVVGAGYVGVELGTAFAKLGTRVTLVEAADRILPTLDADLVRPVAARLGALGVQTLVGARASGVTASGLEVDVAGASREVDAEHVVVAVGRRPSTALLGVEALGVTARDDSLLEVAPDRRLTEHVAAIGDVTEGPALAHKAMAEAAVAVEALGGATTAFEPAAIPAIVFSDPEIATAGLTPAQATAAGVDHTVSDVPVGASGRAATLDEREGFARIVAATEDGAVLGVHIVAPHASDLIAEGVLAIEMGVTLEDLALTVHPHPTLSELVAESAHLGLGAPVHVPPRGDR